MRELKAKDAQHKVELARKIEEDRMRKVHAKLLEKERKSELKKQQLLKEVTEKGKLRQIKMEKAAKAAEEQERKVQQQLREKEKKREFKE